MSRPSLNEWHDRGMETFEGPLPTPREMVDAFVHAPLLVPIGERVDGEDFVVVLSHVELWPWRVVVRALVANPNFAPQSLRLPTGNAGASSGVGVVTADVVALTEQHHERWRRQIEWMNSWELADDTGTQFNSSGWSGGPSDDQLWSDLELRYDTIVPPNAHRLTISGPTFDSIEVALRP